MKILLPTLSMNLSNLLWDTRLQGNARARLTPWLYEDHKSAVESGLAGLSVTDPDLHQIVKKAYEDLWAINSPATATKEETIDAPTEDVKPEVIEATVEVSIPETSEVIEPLKKKRGRKPKNS